ncbi:MAG: YbaB/EbfC family nucleoid-associated protein [Spirochaetaceae bacterium]|jgi:DNA-binding YbaB/EbfC family protein|nr:YbaB/EbfC family nucleoid-associated protein [Spirochaetaceae bacterium]
MTIDPMSLLKNAQNLRQQFSTALEQMKKITAEGMSGGGLVKVTLNGNFELEKIVIDPTAVDNRDVAMLQDLIISAHHDAQTKIRETLNEKLSPALANGMFSDFSL